MLETLRSLNSRDLLSTSINSAQISARTSSHNIQVGQRPAPRYAPHFLSRPNQTTMSIVLHWI